MRGDEGEGVRERRRVRRVRTWRSKVDGFATFSLEEAASQLFPVFKSHRSSSTHSRMRSGSSVSSSFVPSVPGRPRLSATTILVSRTFQTTPSIAATSLAAFPFPLVPPATWSTTEARSPGRNECGGKMVDAWRCAGRSRSMSVLPPRPMEVLHISWSVDDRQAAWHCKQKLQERRRALKSLQPPPQLEEHLQLLRGRC